MKNKTLKYKALLILGLEDGALTAMEARRVNGGCEIRRVVRKDLSGDILTGNPELTGAEIRKILEDAEIRVRDCAVSIPLDWVYFLGVHIPESLGEEDEKSFIRLQAEKTFPFSLEDLSLSIRRFENGEGEKHATVAAVPVQHIRVLQKILKAAKLNVKSISIGMVSVVNFMSESSGMFLWPHESGMDMAIGKKGSLLKIRTLPGAVRWEKEAFIVDEALLLRELRITLAGMPEENKKDLNDIYFIGKHFSGEGLSETFFLGLQCLGLKQNTAALTRHGFNLNEPTSPHLCALSHEFFHEGKASFEFLPPFRSRLKSMMDRISSRSALWLVSAGAVIIFIITISFLLQGYFRNRYEKKWNTMRPRVEEAEILLDKLKTYRPWNDEEIKSLEILKEMTKAFPEEDVWIRSLEIRGMEELQFSGTAKNDGVWLEMLGKLRENSTVKDLKVNQVKETDGALQFTVRFSM